MKLKPEVIRSLEREAQLSGAAVAQLEERCRAFETKYGWSTEEFLRKFNAGEIGDDQDYFVWYALAQAKQDWQATRKSLDEVLSGAQPADDNAPHHPTVATFPHHKHTTTGIVDSSAPAFALCSRKLRK